jgi:dTDP-4-amino-4,6-dideoxygalactose transaminase
MGPNVENFEKNVAGYLNTKFARGVANGTDALILSLKSASVGSGDEVITTPFTFIATAEAIVHCGATPVFADVDIATMNIAPKEIIKKITKRTKAIIVVHIFGNPCNMQEIMDIATTNNLTVIEDAAQAFGAKVTDKNIGTIGDIGCFSFFPTKNLSCYGDGGLIVTNNEDIYNKVKTLQNHGSSQKYYHNAIGYNSRLDDIQAAILNVKLKYVDVHNKKRRDIARFYIDNLQNYLSFQREYPESKNVYHQFTIRCPAHISRDVLQKFLQENCIETSIYYPLPLHLQESIRKLGIKCTDLENAEELSKKVLSIPMHPYLKQQELMAIIEKIRCFFENRAY